jgi:mannose-6-phosphate isomerase-like protein (cupin superfamily)
VPKRHTFGNSVALTRRRDSHDQDARRKLSYVCFPARSAGKRSLGESDLAGGMAKGNYEDPAMHRSDSVDYAFILSGRIDYALPSGEIRTFGPGACVISAGVGHAWRNPYDEPCIYASISLGVHGTVHEE